MHIQKTLRKSIKYYADKFWVKSIINLRGQVRGFLRKEPYGYSSGSFDVYIYAGRQKRKLCLSMLKSDGTLIESILYHSGRMVIKTKDLDELREIREEMKYIYDNVYNIVDSMTNIDHYENEAYA